MTFCRGYPFRPARSLVDAERFGLSFDRLRACCNYHYTKHPGGNCAIRTHGAVTPVSLATKWIKPLSQVSWFGMKESNPHWMDVSHHRYHYNNPDGANVRICAEFSSLQERHIAFNASLAGARRRT